MVCVERGRVGLWWGSVHRGLECCHIGTRMVFWAHWLRLWTVDHRLWSVGWQLGLVMMLFVRRGVCHRVGHLHRHGNLHVLLAHLLDHLVALLVVAVSVNNLVILLALLLEGLHTFLLRDIDRGGQALCRDPAHESMAE